MIREKKHRVPDTYYVNNDYIDVKITSNSEQAAENTK